MQSMQSIWSPDKLQVDFGNYLAGPSANENPPGLHVESSGVHLESMGQGKVLPKLKKEHLNTY